MLSEPVLSENLLTIEADALHPSDNYESMNIGAEYGFHNTLFLCGGYQSLFLTDNEGGLSCGVGVLANLFGDEIKGRFDYAYTDFARLKVVHVFALSVLF